MWRNMLWFMIGAVCGVVIDNLLGSPSDAVVDIIKHEEPAPTVTPYVPKNGENSPVKKNDPVETPTEVELFLEPETKKKRRRIHDD